MGSFFTAARLQIAECGLKKKTKKNPKSAIRKNWPILFPRNPANGGTSGSQACFLAEKAITKVGKRIFFLDGDFLGRIN
jgi:hypothetical protein